MNSPRHWIDQKCVYLDLLGLQDHFTADRRGRRTQSQKQALTKIMTPAPLRLRHTGLERNQSVELLKLRVVVLLLHQALFAPAASLRLLRCGERNFNRFNITLFTPTFDKLSSTIYRNLHLPSIMCVQ